TEMDGWRIVTMPAFPAWRRVAGIARVGTLSIGRHLEPRVRRAVASIVADGGIDVVHCEQLQALPQCAGARDVPIVLRVQNVEHEIAAARRTRGLRGMLWMGERGRLAAFERGAVRTA